MEKLDDYKCRVNSFCWDSLPGNGEFWTNPRLEEKVDPNGNFENFIGNTIVYTLPESFRMFLEKVREELYENVGEMLAQKLSPENFHLTLHDLKNGLPTEELRKQIQETGQAAMDMLREIDRSKVIRLKPTALFNMVNTSLVLGLEPADEESCYEVMSLYEKLQGIVNLNYPLTLHVTISYFKPGTYSEECVAKLRNFIAKINEMEKREVLLSESWLQYWEFESMDIYFFP